MRLLQQTVSAENLKNFQSLSLRYLSQLHVENSAHLNETYDDPVWRRSGLRQHGGDGIDPAPPAMGSNLIAPKSALPLLRL